MRRVGPYHLDGLVGWGATAAVWRARAGASGLTVAVKRARAVDRDAADRLRHEAAVLATLDHPGVVSLLDVVDDGDQVALVLPWVDGGTLHDRLVARGPLDALEAEAVLGPIAAALGAVHDHGLAHGDVSAANVLLSSTGGPLLCDFGSARPVPPDGPGRPDEDGRGLAALAALCRSGHPAGRRAGRPAVTRPFALDVEVPAAAPEDRAAGRPPPGDRAPARRRPPAPVR